MYQRRNLLKFGLGAAVGAGLGASSTLAWALPVSEARRLNFHHLHTGETLGVTYFEDGRYVPGAMAEVNHLLRDFRSGDVHQIDPRLLDLLAATKRRTDFSGAFEVISGYRSPATNAMLHDHSGEVAKKSLHMQGMAIDIHQPGVDLMHTYAAARGLGLGGVGYYPQSRFVHIDVGEVRHWEGT